MIKMFTVEKIEDNLVRLENRETKEYLEVEKEILPSNIKEGDILDFIKDKYVINKNLTENKKNNIRSRFDSLMN